MEIGRPTTPPPRRAADGERPPLTPEQMRRIETNRLKAKAIREQKEAEAQRSNNSARLGRTPSGFITGASAGNGIRASGESQNVRYSARAVVDAPTTLRDGRTNQEVEDGGKRKRPMDDIRPAQKFSKFVEYDFSKMTDTKGGFLTVEDDPYNKALHAPTEEKPAHMTLEEWERHQLLRSLRNQKAGPFEPGISVLKKETENMVCRECGSLEVDWKWEEVFSCLVCSACKEKYPEKYSLLTKTEAREDYLLTDPELKDVDLLPHLERPNPHKSSWNNMMLYLRYQVEEYAFSDKKWGSPEALDEAFAKRESEKKMRKEKKFKTKLQDLKKRTRTEAWRRNRDATGGEFGDAVGRVGKHQHEWGTTVTDLATGMGTKRCVECGLEVEEVEL